MPAETPSARRGVPLAPFRQQAGEERAAFAACEGRFPFRQRHRQGGRIAAPAPFVGVGEAGFAVAVLGQPPDDPPAPSDVEATFAAAERLIGPVQS